MQIDLQRLQLFILTAILHSVNLPYVRLRTKISQPVAKWVTIDFVFLSG